MLSLSEPNAVHQCSSIEPMLSLSELPVSFFFLILHSASIPHTHLVSLPPTSLLLHSVSISHHTHTWSHSLQLLFSHTLSLSFTHTWSHSLQLIFSHTLPLSHSHTWSLPLASHLLHSVSISHSTSKICETDCRRREARRRPGMCVR